MIILRWNISLNNVGQLYFPAHFQKARAQEAESTSDLAGWPRLPELGEISPLVGLDVQKRNVLFWRGFQSVHFLEGGASGPGAMAGKGPQGLWACRHSACCSWNKRETERSVAVWGSHAPGLLEMFSQSENWRQMGTCYFGCLAPSSLLLKCYSKPVNPEELKRERAQRKQAPPKSSYEGLSDAPQVLPTGSAAHLVN